ncbi:type I restriction enzyme HsdR N-terminal domain-containing protein [Ichthyobacterium seriolicida]|uniref:Type I restriction enzyme R protein N-terminal domain-containing protein n=1 Tax=Ichthyobacterium seriolicida TaxID=242600 RepID=A0A1J1DZ79_9FLAO|nr:type I restriction enzyme HsdR N-terminal domain-containing protein [Ichthyobacterium seriolicida]BAV95223.1 hypothetical protein JBKA6_1210 [Ichthyobacterium seriolicida]
MIKLNFPEYRFKLREAIEKKLFIFDIIRKKYVLLTPEEWVRQHIIRYLIDKGYPAVFMAVESALKIGYLKKRADIIVYNTNMKPMVIVECKSPDTLITQKTFDQASLYAAGIGVEYLIITNGKKHYSAFINNDSKEYNFLEEIPDYSSLR